MVERYARSLITEATASYLIRTFIKFIRFIGLGLIKMGKENDEFLSMLEKHRELELNNVQMSKEKEEQLKSAGAKLMLYQIRMDSKKHAKILQTLIDTIKEGTPEYLWDYRIDRYVGQVATERLLQKHVEIEEEMIQRHEAAIKKTDNPGIQMILQHIVEDEKRHHKMLKEVIKQLHKLGP